MNIQNRTQSNIYGGTLYWEDSWRLQAVKHFRKNLRCLTMFKIHSSKLNQKYSNSKQKIRAKITKVNSAKNFSIKKKKSPINTSLLFVINSIKTKQWILKIKRSQQKNEYLRNWRHRNCTLGELLIQSETNEQNIENVERYSDKEYLTDYNSPR